MSEAAPPYVVALCAALIAAQLVACTAPPDVGASMSSRILVLPAGADAPVSCRSLGRITVSDGVAEGPRRYDGTDAGALAKLRQAAQKLGANILVPLDRMNPANRDVPLDPIYFDCPHCKQVVYATGHAYRCVPSS